MILVTGGTGFLGRALVRELVSNGHQVRLLIRPSARTPNLPRGVPVEVAVTSLGDERGIRAAMRGVDVVYHLASAERDGIRGNIIETDARGTNVLTRVAAESRIRRLFYISQLGADRSSYYPILKVKGIAEGFVRKSGVPHTIFRSSLLYGPEDHFTTALARMAGIFPLLFTPRSGDTLLQPLWVEDLVTCLLWSLDNRETINQTYEVGGSEHYTFKQSLELILETTQMRRLVFPLGLAYLRQMTVVLESIFPRFPFSSYSVDYFSYNRTCAVDVLPRVFGFLPARFSYRLEHLKSINWTQAALRSFFN